MCRLFRLQEPVAVITSPPLEFRWGQGNPIGELVDLNRIQVTADAETQAGTDAVTLTRGGDLISASSGLDDHGLEYQQRAPNGLAGEHHVDDALARSDIDAPIALRAKAFCCFSCS